MKRFRSLFIIMSLLLTLSVLVSCQNRMIQEPTIKVSYDSNELKVIHYLDRNNKEKEDIEEGIKSFMVGKRFTDLPMINFGEKIEIEALNFETTEFEVCNYIIDENGDIVSDYGVESFTITLDGNESVEVMFEKDADLEIYNDYKVEGKSIHCILIRSKINKSSFAFGTLVLGANKE